MRFHGISALLLMFLASCGPTYTTRVLDTPQTRELKGHQKPYTVNGKRYDPLRSHQGYVEEGVASWYGPDFHGKKTSNGETYDMYAMTAAHKTLPMGVYVRVTHRESSRSVVVRVNDRGPFVKGRLIDLSFVAAKELGVVGPGTAPVRVEALGYRADGADGQIAYREPTSYDIGSYAIQLGAFGVMENAQRFAAEMQAKHGSSRVSEGWVDGKRFYRVWVGDYRSLEQAEVAKGTFEQDDYPGCFVVALE